jgi:hypothetical protein
MAWFFGPRQYPSRYFLTLVLYPAQDLLDKGLLDAAIASLFLDALEGDEIRARFAEEQRHEAEFIVALRDLRLQKRVGGTDGFHKARRRAEFMLLPVAGPSVDERFDQGGFCACGIHWTHSRSGYETSITG